MNTAIQKWIENGPLVLDGGMGTQLQLLGLPTGAHPDLWNLTEPEKVGQVARSYIEAGSDIILTNTFGSTSFCLKKHGQEKNVAKINNYGAKIAKKAAEGTSVKVFASIGPTGVLLMMGEVSETELYDAFLEQATALKDAGVDAIVAETMSDLTEASLAVKAIKAVGLPAVASMTFDSGKNKDRTMMGVSVEQMVDGLTEAGADVLGSNCGQGIDGFLPICRRMRARTELPLWMKGNAGLPQMIDGKTTYLQTPEHFAQTARLLLDEGANFIGGCCGTTPDYIRELKKVI